MDIDWVKWPLFAGVVLVLLVFDLGVLHRRQREIGVRESLLLSGFYILISCAFGIWVWHLLGPERGREYFTGYLIEKSLSLDNIFVMSLIFGAFAVPRIHQHRVLFWGILGVLILRGAMIGVGAALVEHFHWLLYGFAGFLIFTGIKMLFAGEEEDPDIQQNRLLNFVRARLRVTPQLHGEKFFVRLPHPANLKRRQLFATPLFLTLVLVELADLIFAMDSVPAIFAITTDPFVIFTSNLFAILGLRSLYFALAAILPRFAYLKYALSLVLIFIGGKVIVAELLDLEKIPASLSLGVTFALLAGGVLFSLYKTRKSAA